MIMVRRLAEVALILLLLSISGCGREHKITTRSPDALKSYQEGVAHYEKFYYREALASFEDALRKDSTFAMAQARMAMLHWAGRDEDRARKDISQALQLSSGASEREQLLIRIWSQLINYDLAGASVTADTLVLLYPDEPEVHLVRGNLYEQEKNLEAAIASYLRAVQVDTAYAPAVMSLGYAYSTMGEPEKAAIQMKKYIRLAPEAADPRASYADILVRVGRYEDALEQYRKSLELKPDYWYAIGEIGRIYVTLGRLREAEEQFHESLKFMPQNRQIEATHMVLDGFLEFYRGKYREAVEQFQGALTIDSNNVDAARGIVYALSKMQQFEEASGIVERIRKEYERRNLTSTPGMLSFHLMRSRVLLEKGDLEQAMAECDSALGFTTALTRSAVYRQMAEIYLRQKAYEAALDACEQALQVNPNSPEVLLTLTRIYKERGDRRMTREIGGRLLNLWSHADPDYQNRIELQKILGPNS